VIKITPTGSKQTIISPKNAGGIEIVNDEIYLNNYSHSGDIFVYDMTGSYVRTIPVPSQASSSSNFVMIPDGRIALLDPYDDKIYFLDASGNLLTTTNIQDSPDSHFQNLDGVVVGPQLIVSEAGDKHLLAFDLSTYQRSIFKDLSSLPDSWLGAITYANGAYFLTTPVSIYRIPDVGSATKIGEIPASNITGLAVINNFAYVSVNFSGEIYKVNLFGGFSSVFTSGLDYPEDLEATFNAIAHDSNLRYLPLALKDFDSASQFHVLYKSLVP